MPGVERTRKPRPPPAPYKSKPGPKGKRTSKPKTSAKDSSNARKNLTLHDWLTVFAFIDEHPDVSQIGVVEHFASMKTGALHFTQSSLSRNLQKRAELQERAVETPSALSSKRARVMTRPDVERALVLWVRSIEEKNEVVNGPMLIAKRERFEELMNVPKAQRMKNNGWMPSFCKT
jgi:hypothetical protein